MIYLALIAVTTLATNGVRQLRYIAVGFAAVTVAVTLIAASVATLPELAVSGCAGLVAAGILFVAARDWRYGEDPGWRLWAATFVAAIITPIAYASFRTVGGETASIAPLEGPSAVIIEVAGIWLLSSGTAVPADGPDRRARLARRAAHGLRRPAPRPADARRTPRADPGARLA